MTVDVLTFGCRLNVSESEVIRARAAEAGLSNALVVNSCAVTAEAVRQARQAIRRARREQPGRRIIVTGCAAQTEPKAFASMAEVDLVLGNREKLAADSYGALSASGEVPGADAGLPEDKMVRVGDIFCADETNARTIDRLEGHARAFVEVQNGCDHRCTFCIIPFGRGNSRSVPAGAVVAQVRRLVESGYREVVLTGVDITAWGADLPGKPRLGALVRSILKHVQELQRLRLSSIDSVEADADLMRAVAEEERVMPHLHLSLQAGDDMILKRMKRRHLRADAIRFCEDVRRLRPDIVFGADLIAGFPTETNEMFENTMALVEECDLTFLHVFPFSPRPGTPAAKLPQVPHEVVKERANRLRMRAKRTISTRLACEVGARRSVLVEQPGFGRTEHYFPVRLDGGVRREIVPVVVHAADASNLLATAIREAA